MEESPSCSGSFAPRQPGEAPPISAEPAPPPCRGAFLLPGFGLGLPAVFFSGLLGLSLLLAIGFGLRRLGLRLTITLPGTCRSGNARKSARRRVAIRVSS